MVEHWIRGLSLNGEDIPLRSGRLTNRPDRHGRDDWGIEATAVSKPSLSIINGKQFDVTAELEDGRTVTATALQPGLMTPPFLMIRLVVSGDVEGLDGS